MTASPYRDPATREEPEHMVLETVHVTNIAFIVLSSQRHGWKLVGAAHIPPVGTLMRLEFERA